MQGICKRVGSLEEMLKMTDHDIKQTFPEGVGKEEEQRRLIIALQNLRKYTGKQNTRLEHCWFLAIRSNPLTLTRDCFSCRMFAAWRKGLGERTGPPLGLLGPGAAQQRWSFSEATPAEVGPFVSALRRTLQEQSVFSAGDLVQSCPSLVSSQFQRNTGFWKLHSPPVLSGRPRPEIHAATHTTDLQQEGRENQVSYDASTS